MGKRKHRERSEDIETVLKKMKKLERKVKKMQNRKLSVSSESDLTDPSSVNNDETPDLITDQVEVTCLEDEINLDNLCQQSEVNLPEKLVNEASETQSVPNESLNNPDEPALPPQLDPEEILTLLGEDPSHQNNYGPNIHKDIASRWSHLLTNGLNKEMKSELVKRYLLPENCPNMRAPKLNMEIKAALLESDLKRDLFSQYKQNQLASSLVAIGQVLNWTLNHKSIVPQEIIKTLNDAGRLICDSHYRESTTRRYATIRTLNKDMKEMVNNTKIDEYLFGAELSEHIKSAKAISKTSSEMKQVPRPLYKTPTLGAHRGALNSRGAPRPAMAAPRLAPAPRARPPPRNSQPAPRGRQSTSHGRHQTRRR